MMSDVEIKTHPRARCVRLQVHPGGRVTVTVPKRCSRAFVERCIDQHHDWIERTRAEMLKKTAPVARGDARRSYLSHKEAARRLVYALIAKFAPVYGVTVRAVSIRDQKSRWGSCARSGRLSFNYRLAFLPTRLAEYVVVHEICHLLEFNHSANFWILVAKTMPEHRTLRTHLRKRNFHALEG